MNQTKTQYKIILDPGHGGIASYGASSPTGVQLAGGIAEKHVNLALAQRIATRLGPVAALTRNDDVNLPITERAQLAARLGGDALVSLHANDNSKNIYGNEVWLHEDHDYGSGTLASNIHASLQELGPVRGVFKGKLSVLDPQATGEVPACLVEVDYPECLYGGSQLIDSNRIDDLANAISTGIYRYLSAAVTSRTNDLNIAYGGLPNLTFGPIVNGRPLGAVKFSSMPPFVGTPVSINWVDHNESETDAGPYQDSVWILNNAGNKIFSKDIKIKGGIKAHAMKANFVVWTPKVAEKVTAYVQLNTGENPISEHSLKDNKSSVTTAVNTVKYGNRQYYGNKIAVREVSGPNGLSKRYLSEQPLTVNGFNGYMDYAYDFKNRFIWLVWPKRRRQNDPKAKVDIDLMMDLFVKDPERDTTAKPIDSRIRRIQLSEGSSFGYEYSRLPSDVNFYIRIRFTDYSNERNAGSVLWTQGYG